MVPAFPVAHFDGSAFPSPLRRFRVSKYWTKLKSVSSSRLLRFWDFEVLDERNWVASPSGGVLDGRNWFFGLVDLGRNFEVLDIISKIPEFRSLVNEIGCQT
ncbi:unnamed protein product [Rhizophagus irregularis]|nr:unnamed protein product [Rhizophagus irregularis]